MIPACLVCQTPAASAWSYEKQPGKQQGKKKKRRNNNTAQERASVRVVQKTKNCRAPSDDAILAWFLSLLPSLSRCPRLHLRLKRFPFVRERQRQHFFCTLPNPTHAVYDSSRPCLSFSYPPGFHFLFTFGVCGVIAPGLPASGPCARTRSAKAPQALGASRGEGRRESPPTRRGIGVQPALGSGLGRGWRCHSRPKPGMHGPAVPAQVSRTPPPPGPVF